MAKVGTMYGADLTLQHAFTAADSASIGALTLLGNKLYVSRRGTAHIEVYDTSDESWTTAMPGLINIPGLGAQVYGLAACPATNRLYVSDWDNQCIHCIDLVSTVTTATRWNVSNQPAGLSLTPDGANLLVTCHGAGCLQEYGTAATDDHPLHREIRLTDDARLAWHAVEITAGGQYVVSFEGPTHRVCIISSDGHIIRSCGDGGVEAEPMLYPRSIAVGATNAIFVADQCKNRILIIDPATAAARQLVTPVDGGLRGPHGLCLDKARGLLFIGEWDGGRILVLAGLKLE